MKTLPRSFGFEFRSKLFEGTILQDPSSGRLDVYVFYDGQEFPCMGDFHRVFAPNTEEIKYLNDKVNEFINKQ